jgi:hypothetical protein
MISIATAKRPLAPKKKKRNLPCQRARCIAFAAFFTPALTYCLLCFFFVVVTPVIRFARNKKELFLS